MTVHIRRTASGRDWCATLEPSGYLCGCEPSLDYLVTRLVHHSEVVLHLEPSEATRNIDRYIRDYEREIEQAQRTIRSNKAVVKRYRAEREEIVRRHSPDHNT